MTIKETTALSLAEANEYIEDEEINGFVKKFVKIKPDEAKKLRNEIDKLDNIKIKSEHIVKIIDLLPEDEQDLAKIFNEVSLDSDEISKILEIVKKYR
jgi:DNA-directed RNA polymerase subunit F